MTDKPAAIPAAERGVTEAQRARAILPGTKDANNNVGEAFHDNVDLSYAGVPASELTAAQRDQLLKLTGMFVGNMDDGHARVKMDEVRRHIDRTYFAWLGGRQRLLLSNSQPGDPHRVRSPASRGPPAHLPAQAVSPAHPRGDSYAKRQRLRQGSVAAALR